jgi:dihydrofolate reductase
MGTIATFTHVSLDGYFAGPNGEIDWFKNTPPDPEFDAFNSKEARSRSTLLFGRTTYEMMQRHWPTEESRLRATSTPTRSKRRRKSTIGTSRFSAAGRSCNSSRNAAWC